MGRDAASRLHDGGEDVSEERLDADALVRLKRIGGDRLLEAMLASFLTNASQRIEEARAAAGSSDFEALSAAAHALKSSAGNVGAVRFQHAAARVEIEAERPGADARALLEELLDAWRGAESAVAHVRETRAAD